MKKKLAAVLILLIGVLQSPLNVALSATLSESELSEIKAQIEVLKNGSTPLEKRKITECANILTDIYDAETLVFLSFLEENFANKSATSSLAKLAIYRYAQYKQSLDESFARFNPSLGDNFATNYSEEQFANYQSCSLIHDMYLESAREILMRHIKSSAAAKKTTIFLERYQSINSKLNDLNFEIATMYSYFMTFKNKLPGFLQQCLSG